MIPSINLKIERENMKIFFMHYQELLHWTSLPFYVGKSNPLNYVVIEETRLLNVTQAVGSLSFLFCSPEMNWNHVKYYERTPLLR